MVDYISMKSPLAPYRIWKEMMSADKFDAPWVRIGNLYASVTFTGSESWAPVVLDLNKRGQKKFAVLAGRHGDQLGQQIDPVGHKFVLRDSTSAGDSAINPKDDQAMATSLNKRGNGIDVTVVDVGDAGYNTVDALRGAISSFLMRDMVVILAWCYSLCAMKPGWYGTLKGVWPEAFKGADMVSIEHTAKDWQWVLYYGTSAASNAAGETARVV